MTFAFKTMAAACAAFMVIAALGCAPMSAEPDGDRNPGKNTGKTPGPAYFYDFRQQSAEAPAGLKISDWDFYSDDFAQVHWTRDNVTFGPEGMRIIAKHERKGKSSVTSGEVQVEGFYGYGRYEAVFKTAVASGLDNAFFLHTYSGMGDPHDEIDMEFVGSRPKSAFLNYFHNGVAYNNLWTELGFDPSAELHLYAFEWSPQSIRWYVDGKLLREQPASAKPALPRASQRPLFNLLAGAPVMNTWLGERRFESGAHMLVTCTSHVPAGGTGQQCSQLADLAGAHR